MNPKFFVNLLLIIFIFNNCQAKYEDILGEWKLFKAIISGSEIKLPSYSFGLEKESNDSNETFHVTAKAVNNYNARLSKTNSDENGDQWEIDLAGTTLMGSDDISLNQESLYFYQISSLNYLKTYENSTKLLIKSPTGELYFDKVECDS